MSGDESREPSRDIESNDRENAGLQTEESNVENSVQIAPKRGRKD